MLKTSFGIDVAVVETQEWFDGAAWGADGAKVAELASTTEVYAERCRRAS